MEGHLLQRFLGAAERVPDRTALASRDRAVTYSELTRMVGGVARHLSEVGRPGDRVAILSENSAEYVAAIYGSWAAGLAAVGLNPALRAAELAGLVRHAGAVTTLVDPKHPEASSLEDLLTGSGTVIRLGELTTGGTEIENRPESDSEALATIIYTSGTTGHPKGVMLSHGNLAANTTSIQATLPIGSDDRALCVLPFQYSYGSSVLHTHLTLGATVLLERSLMYPHQVLERAQAEQATSLAGVPATFYLLMDRLDLRSYDLGSLRYVTQAGGRMAPERIAQFQELLPETQFIVMYGQTEASARLACLPAGALGTKSGSAGRPIPGVTLEVRTEEGESLPAGSLGEVWAKGQNVMQGYWSDPTGSEVVLVDGWLKTGDLGRMDEDGYLFLEGRSRDFIKSGAYRISPSEIEDVIRTVDGVDDVAVVGREDATLGEAIHAHVLGRSQGDDVRRAIMRACIEKLPRYKVPQHIHFQDHFPRTASGKIQRHLL